MKQPGVRIVALVAAMLALVACGNEPADTGPAPSPLLFEIVNADGDVEGWMLGTIHALPDGTEWRTGRIDRAISEADLLVVEIAALEDRAALTATFAHLAAAPSSLDLSERVEPEERPALFDLLSRSEYSAHEFATVDTWAAALMLAQTGASGNSQNGVDRAVIREFENREIIEFEGAAKQLGIFDALAEEDQRDLLSGVIEEATERREDPGKLRRAWLAGDMEVLVDATRSGIMADTELREALLVGRNRDWTEQLVPILEEAGQPLVAVGTAHLVGPDGLPAMLEAKGYTVKLLD